MPSACRAPVSRATAHTVETPYPALSTVAGGAAPSRVIVPVKVAVGTSTSSVLAPAAIVTPVRSTRHPFGSATLDAARDTQRSPLSAVLAPRE